MQRRLNSETGVNRLFESVSCQGRIQKFFEGEKLHLPISVPKFGIMFRKI